MGTVSITRYHDFSAGHRVVGHENKCANLHGHNYRVYFTCTAQELDALGRVIDFGVVKEKLCNWLEENWDHKFLAWDKDPLPYGLLPGMRFVPFNPTAENMAEHLVNQVGPDLLWDTDVVLTQVTVQETRKCSATYTRETR